MDWKVSPEPVEYNEAVAFMEKRVADIRAGDEDNLIWALEHPHLYTAGTSAKEADLLHAKFPVYQSGRGGQYTYHGPGQRIYYLMYNLKDMFQVPDIKKYIWTLEELVILSLSDFGLSGERRDGRVGIWLVSPEGVENKIAAIGVRVRHWVSYHGISVNISPDLDCFSGIVPCGIQGHGVTSFAREGLSITSKDFDEVMKKNAEKLLGSRI